MKPYDLANLAVLAALASLATLPAPALAQPAAPADDFSTLRGANYVPSYARNDLQIWLDYDPAVIDRELGYAERLKLNTVRVFLHVAVYEQDPKLFLERLEGFLALCAKHRIRMMPVVFDSCFGDFPDLKACRDRDWMANPGQNRLGPEHWPAMEKYVRDVVGGHKDDPRIVMWDVMNEPTCTRFNKPDDKKLIHAFLDHFLDYVRQQDASHPRTVGWESSSLIPRTLDKTEVLAIHNYTPALRDDIRRVAELARKHAKPLIVNEVVGRPNQGFQLAMPILRQEKVGWCFWELMLGKTQFSRNEPPYQGLIYPDGTCWDADEVAAVMDVTREEALAAFPQRRKPQPEPGEMPDTSPAIRYSDGWTAWKGAGPPWSSLHYHNSAAAKAELTFEGGSVTLIHKVGPDCGLAEVLMDGKPVARSAGGALAAAADGKTCLDTYSPGVDWNRRTLLADKLAPGKHTITILVTGRKNPGSTNTYVQIVGFVVH